MRVTTQDSHSAFPLALPSFRPAPGLHNAHVQTLLPYLLRKRLKIQPFWQTLTLPDGDTLRLAWSEPWRQAGARPCVVLLPGLEGDVYSPYAHGLLSAFRHCGWLGVTVHARGCGHDSHPGRQPKLYHAAHTDDVLFVLRWLRQRMGACPLAAVGVSLGGSMLAWLLAQTEAADWLQAATIVSAPLQLAVSSDNIERGFARLYERYLLYLLKQHALRKLTAFPDSLPASAQQIRALRHIRDFDQAITARLYDFGDARTYYERCSAARILPQITTPLLLIQAQDDPLTGGITIPDRAGLPDAIRCLFSAHGGHVGFVTGSPLRPRLWLEQVIPAWLTPFLDAAS